MTMLQGGVCGLLMFVCTSWLEHVLVTSPKQEQAHPSFIVFRELNDSRDCCNPIIAKLVRILPTVGMRSWKRMCRESAGEVSHNLSYHAVVYAMTLDRCSLQIQIKYLRGICIHQLSKRYYVHLWQNVHVTTLAKGAIHDVNGWACSVTALMWWSWEEHQL